MKARGMQVPWPRGNYVNSYCRFPSLSNIAPKWLSDYGRCSLRFWQRCTHLAMAEASDEGVTRPEAEPREAPNPAADLALRKFGLSWCSSNWGHAKLVLLPSLPKYYPHKYAKSHPIVHIYIQWCRGAGGNSPSMTDKLSLADPNVTHA